MFSFVRFSFLLILVLLSGCATTDAAKVESGNQDKSVVRKAEPQHQEVHWRYRGTQDYEAMQSGLGSSRRYESRIGWVDVYDYTLGRKDWQEGVSDPAFAGHFQSVVEEILMAEKAGYYINVSVGRPKDVTLSNVTFRHVKASYMTKQGDVESHVYMTAMGGRLLKFRVSLFRPTPSSVTAEVERFINGEVARLLKDRVI